MDCHLNSLKQVIFVDAFVGFCEKVPDGFGHPVLDFLGLLGEFFGMPGLLLLQFLLLELESFSQFRGSGRHFVGLKREDERTIKENPRAWGFSKVIV